MYSLWEKNAFYSGLFRQLLHMEPTSMPTFKHQSEICHDTEATPEMPFHLDYKAYRIELLLPKK